MSEESKKGMGTFWEDIEDMGSLLVTVQRAQWTKFKRRAEPRAQGKAVESYGDESPGEEGDLGDLGFA